MHETCPLVTLATSCFCSTSLSSEHLPPMTIEWLIGNFSQAVGFPSLFHYIHITHYTLMAVWMASWVTLLSEWSLGRCGQWLLCARDRDRPWPGCLGGRCPCGRAGPALPSVEPRRHPGYMSRTIRKFRTDKFNTRNRSFDSCSSCKCCQPFT